MPRKIAVEPEDAIPVVKQFMKHFQTDDLPAWSAEVWKEMSIALGGKWNFGSWYTNVRKDRNGILSTARQEMGIIIRPKIDDNNISSLQESTTSIEKSDSDESYSGINNDGLNIGHQQLESFDLVLTEKQWNEIKPDIPEGSSKLKLKSGVWTNEIAISFFQVYRLPCAFLFKRAEVTLSQNEDIYSIKITGSCKSKKCSNIFRGYAEKKVNAEGLTIQITTRDTRSENHEAVKRPFNGKRRKDGKKDLKGECASIWRKKEARGTMRTGETSPPTLPKDYVARQARLEAVNEELGVGPKDGRDLIRTLENMSCTPEYAGIIQDLGSLPFHVIYSTPAQLYAYKEYCRLNKNSSISLDATGGVVRVLERNGRKSGHIFLYAIVINFDNTTISVHQMLSEKHTTEFIEFWLRQWQRGGAPKPKQIVCDYSRALLCGISLAFNNQTIKSYVEDSFSVISRADVIKKKPETIIRVDVAHVIHAVCRWKCWKSIRQTCIKEFFVRCIALMVECVTFSDFQRIFYLTCVVALQPHQDAGIHHSMAQTVKDARKILENDIAVRRVQVDFEIQGAADNLEHPKAHGMTECDESDQNSGSIGHWVDGQVSRAKEINRDGEELNPFYIPEFVKMLSLRAREFPLWTSVGMDYSTPHATSSHVEGYFNDIKTRVLTTKPLRLDKFLKIHARDIEGATLLFSSSMIHFNAERCAQNTSRIENEDVTIRMNVPQERAQIQNPRLEKNEQKSGSTELLSSMKQRKFDDAREIISAQNTGPIENEDVTIRMNVPQERAPIKKRTLEKNEQKSGSTELVSSMNQRKLGEISAQLKTTAINNEEGIHFTQSSFSNKRNKIGKPLLEQSLQPMAKCKQTSDLFAPKKSQGQFEIDELSCDQLLNIDMENVSHFVEMTSNDTEVYLDDSDLYAVEKWRGKVQADINFDYDSPSDLNEGTLHDQNGNENSPSFMRLSGELDIINNNSEARNGSWQEHSYSMITDLISPNIESPSNTHIGCNLNEGSKLSPIPSTHLVSNCEEQVQDCHRETKNASKYFKAYPEIRQRNALVGQRKKAALLPHGSLIPPIKIKENKKETRAYSVTNTCAFDSLVHVLMTGGIDDVNYCAFLETSSNPTLKLVYTLIQKGVTKDVLRQRVLILKNYYLCKPHLQTNLRVVSYNIDAFDNIAKVVKQNLETEPSVKNTTTCTRCNGRTYPTVVLGPNHKTIGKEGFGSLEKSLNFRSPIYHIRCNDPCLGYYTWYREPRIHIFIELDIRRDIEYKTGLNCKLEQMPTTINLQFYENRTYEYRLAGVVSYISGHYIAYCLRSSGIWEMFDDMRKDIPKCVAKTLVKPHLAVYIRQSEINKQNFR